jgi:hypothetical protein
VKQRVFLFLGMNAARPFPSHHPLRNAPTAGFHAAEAWKRHSKDHIDTDWDNRAHGRAAPFKCNDEMLDDKFAATGVVLFGGNGVALGVALSSCLMSVAVSQIALPSNFMF